MAEIGAISLYTLKTRPAAEDAVSYPEPHISFLSQAEKPLSFLQH